MGYVKRSSCISFIITCALIFVTFISAALPARAENKEYLNVDFAGTFTPQHGYTTGGEETVGGGSLAWQGAALPGKADDGGIILAGNTAGITYTAQENFGENTVDKGFIAEFEYLNTEIPSNLATLFSAMGNISVRVQNNTLEYLFSVQTADGTWKDYKNSVALPQANRKNIIQLKYEAGQSASLTMWVNGVKAPTVSSAAGEKAAVSNGKAKVFGIGCEVNPAESTATRGFAGRFYRARVADTSAPWKFMNLNQLLRVDFSGRLEGSNYVSAGDEDQQGTLTARQPLPSLKDSRADFSGETSGLDFSPTGFSLGVDKVTAGFAAEMKFTPSEAAAQQTLFAAGGNVFLRYSASGQLEFGVSYQENNTWKDTKISAAAPAGEVHVVSVAYVPDGDKAKLYMRVDGVDQSMVQSGGLATLNNTIAAKVAFANEVHPRALNRGFKGTLDEIRFATADSSFTPGDFKLAYVAENCDTSDVTPANTIDVSATDCADLIKAKLSALRPTEKQADYLDWGQIGFVHFGINTFTGKSWGHGDEDPALIDAEKIDTDQWAQTFADAGFKMMMVTVKHHDGFELFDSRYNDRHDWPNTTTAKKGGPKDLFAQIVKSARKYGLKVGVYYSPADSYMEKQKVWGNKSAKVERTIPTLLANDDRTERVASGELPTFTYEATDYGQYMLNQLYELLTDYGTIDEVWFDGAQGNTSSTEFYDYGAFYDLIGKLQPTAVQANAAPDARWIGNEDGWARTSEWNPQGVSFDQYGKMTLHPKQTSPDGVLGSTNSIIEGVRSGAVTKLHWYPGEVDAKNGPEWFNNSNKRGPNTPKPVSEIVKFYEQSTGRNAQFLLNMPPYTDGNMPEADVNAMRGYREELLRRYGKDLALGKEASVAASQDTQAQPAPHLTDGSKISSDPAAGLTPVYTVKLGSESKVDAVILGEDARNAGQQVEEFKVQGRSADGGWKDLASGTTIGQQRNIRFAETTVSEIRVLIQKARGAVRLARLEVFHSESEIQPDARAYFIDPTADKAGDGLSADSPMTSIEQLHDVSLVPGSVILVKNGTKLTGDFAVFGYGTADAPITVTTYGEGDDPRVAFNDVKATTLPDALSELGKDDAGWKFVKAVKELPKLRRYIMQEDIKVVSQSSQNKRDGEVSHLLDGRLDTIWHSQWQPSKVQGPHWVVLDLGKKYENIAYLNYLARPQGRNGVAQDYKVWVSDSADDFNADPIAGTLKNLPYTQRIDLKGASGRYIKFQIDSDYSGQGFGSAAELNVELDGVAPQIPATPTIPTGAVYAESADDTQGSVTVSPEGKQEVGTKVTITASPNAGFKFLNWTDSDGKEISRESRFVATVENRDMRYIANFTAVSAGPDDPGSSIDPGSSSDSSVHQNSSVKPNVDKPNAHLSRSGLEVARIVMLSCILVALGVALIAPRKRKHS